MKSRMPDIDVKFTVKVAFRIPSEQVTKVPTLEVAKMDMMSSVRSLFEDEVKGATCDFSDMEITYLYPDEK